MSTRRKKGNPAEIGGQSSDVYKVPSDYEVSAYNLVYDRMAKAKLVNDNLKFNMKKWQDMASSRLDMTAIDGQGNLINQRHRTRVCLPIVENGIRALLAKYVVSLLVRRPFFRLTPIGIMDDETAKRVENALVYMFDKMPNFIRNMITLIQEMLIFGTAIGKVYWKKQVRYTKKGEVIEYEGAYVEPIHLENFFIDPEATQLDGFWKLHRTWVTNKELKIKNDSYKQLTGKDLYMNLDIIGPGETGYTRKDDGSWTIIWDKQQRGMYGLYGRLNEYYVNEIWEYWSEDNSRVIIVANRRIVIYDGPNPNDSGTHPFIMAVYEPVPFEFYGKGVCEKCRDTHTLLQDITNQIASNVKLLNNPGYFTTPDNMSTNQIISREGKVTIVRDINEVKEKSVIPLGSDVYVLQQTLIRKIEEMIGSTVAASATGTPIGNQAEASATGRAIDNRLANEFHSLNMLLLEVPMLMEIVKRAYLLLQQYAGEEYEFRITDQPGPGFLHKEDLMDVNFSPKIGVDMMSSEVKVNTIATLLQSLAGIPGLAPDLIPILLEEAGKMLGVHFKNQVSGPQLGSKNASTSLPGANNAIPGPVTGMPGAIQPEQMPGGKPMGEVE